MNDSGIYISAAIVKSRSPDERAWLFGLLTGDGPAFPSLSGDDAASQSTPAEEDQNEQDEHFAELSPGQARDYYTGCGEKTKKALEAMAASSSRFFQVADVAKAVGVPAPELRGVWGGLTRRLQTVTGDAAAYLVDWNGSEPEHDENGVYIDQRGELTELTYRSLRKALKL